MQILVAKQARLMDQQLRQKLKDIDRAIARLERERTSVEKTLQGATGPSSAGPVSCPKCGRDRDFLTDNGGYLGHVLEDPSDTEDLEAGKPLFCPSCGDVFLCPRLSELRAKN